MDDPKLPSAGRFARFRKLATLSAQLSTDVVTRGVKRLAGGDEGLLSLGAAEKLVATLGDMKGAAMKFGQAMSMDPDLLTPELRSVLARLQNQAPSMSFATVQRVINEELGTPPQALFQTFDPAPLAAASLGQVHAATLKDGRAVVVKIQYPGITEALGSDLDNLGLLVKTVSRTTKLLDGRTYFQELRAEMLLEVDYLREAALARAFAVAAAPLEDLKVPHVFDELSAARVLTLERLEGVTLREFQASAASPSEKFRVSRQLIRAIYGPFLLAGEIHADPHPGNFLVLTDGRLGVLDFGSVKRFSPSFVEENRRVLRAGVVGAPIDALASCRALGFSIDLPDAEAAPLVQQVLHLAGRPLSSERYDYAQDMTAVQLRNLFASMGTALLKIRPPAEAVMFFRSIGGLGQNLKLIGAEGPFLSVYRELAALLP